MHASFVRSSLAVAGLAVGLVASLAAEEPASPLPSEDLSGPPVVTARAWVVAEGANGGFLAAEKAETPLKVASTTKMMTCLVVLELYVVVLGSAGNEARYADARNLFRWAWSQAPGAE